MSTRRVVLVILLALAEASVIEPLLLVLPTPLRLVDSGVALAVTWVLLSAISLSRQEMAARDTKATQQRMVLGAWLLGMLVCSIVIANLVEHLSLRSLSVLFVEFGGVLLIWWRGVALGITPLVPDSARLRLQVGLLLFVLYALATLMNSEVNLMIFILPFLVGALFALPISHLERVEESPLGRPVPMDPRWWRGLAWGVGGPLIACVAAATLITGDTLISGLRLLVAVLLVPVLAVAFLAGYLLSLIVSLIFKQGSNPLSALTGLRNLLQQLTTHSGAKPASLLTISPEVRYVIGVIVLLAIIAALIWFTGRARRREVDIRHQSEDLQDLQMPDELPVVTATGRLLRSLSLRRWLAAVTIRRIYVRLSHEADKRGFARQPAQTPYDYLPHLSEAFPDAGDDLRIITGAYVAAHYGEVPDTHEALARIRAAWERVRAIPRQVLPKEPIEQ